MISGFDVFFPSKWSVKDFFAAVSPTPLSKPEVGVLTAPQYSGVLMFGVPFVGHKIWCKTKLNKPANLDIWTGKEEVDIYERENPPPVAKNMYVPPSLLTIGDVFFFLCNLG